MPFSNQGEFRQQVRFLRRQFLQDGELRFTDGLSEGTVTHALKALDVVWLDRIYSPLVTLWVFLGQVLSQDHSCRAAVARLIAHRVSRGQRPCSAETGAYCQARKRLPEKFFAEVARKAGQSLDDSARQWLWKGRRVLCTMAQRCRCRTRRRTKRLIRNHRNSGSAWDFLWHGSRPSFRFPVERFSILASAATLARDKASWEMLRQLWDILRPGDVFLADRYMCAWPEICHAQAAWYRLGHSVHIPQSRLQTRPTHGQR